MEDIEKNEQTRLARTLPLAVNLLVLDGERIRLRQMPFWACVFDTESWATRLISWHLDEAWTAQPDYPDMAVWYRETAIEIEDWLIHRCTLPSHPLLRARIALQPNLVTLRTLPGYIDRILALEGRPVEDYLIDVVLLLDNAGGAMYVEESCRAIADHTSESVDAEIVSSERMSEIVAPYICYLQNMESRDLAQAGASKCQ